LKFHEIFKHFKVKYFIVQLYPSLFTAFVDNAEKLYCQVHQQN